MKGVWWPLLNLHGVQTIKNATGFLLSSVLYNVSEMQKSLFKNFRIKINN